MPESLMHYAFETSD